MAIPVIEETLKKIASIFAPNNVLRENKPVAEDGQTTFLLQFHDARSYKSVLHDKVARAKSAFDKHGFPTQKTTDGSIGFMITAENSPETVEKLRKAHADIALEETTKLISNAYEQAKIITDPLGEDEGDVCFLVSRTYALRETELCLSMEVFDRLVSDPSFRKTLFPQALDAKISVRDLCGPKLTKG